MRKAKLLAILAAVGGPVLAASAQDQARNAPAVVAGEALVVTVKDVKGTAARRVPDKDKPWAPLRAGDRIEEGTVIRTGFRSGVTLLFADNSVVEIGSCTVMGAGRFRKDGKVTRTRIGLRYGTIRANVHKARGPNDFRVATPVAALAVVGTSGDIQFLGDLGLRLRGLSGVWRVLVGTRKRLVRAGEFTDSDLTRSIILIQNGRVVRVIPLVGLSQAEQDALLNYGSGSGILHVFGNDRIIRNPHPSAPPPSQTDGEEEDVGRGWATGSADGPGKPGGSETAGQTSPLVRTWVQRGIDVAPTVRRGPQSYGRVQAGPIQSVANGGDVRVSAPLLRRR